MKYRVTPSVYLAIMAARTAILHGAPTPAEDVAKILSALDQAANSVNRRAGHIGRVNDFFTEIVEDDDLFMLMSPSKRDRMAALHQEGIDLAADDLGLTRDEW